MVLIFIYNAYLKLLLTAMLKEHWYN